MFDISVEELEELIKEYREDIEYRTEEQEALLEEVEVLRIQNEKLRKANKRVANEVTHLKAVKMKAQSLAELKDLYEGVIDKACFDQARAGEMDTSTTLYDQLIQQKSNTHNQYLAKKYGLRWLERTRAVTKSKDKIMGAMTDFLKSKL